MRRITRTLALASLSLTAALPAGAQGLSDWSTILGPQFVSYKFGTGAAAQTVSQISVPLVFILPFNERLSVDVSTAYADSRVTTNGTTVSSISGLTDTQIRGNYVIGDNQAVFTFGLNVPTGMYKVPDGQQLAAGAIGSQFLLYPTSSMGSGLAGTAGLAMAWALGDWNVGAGASYRASTPFDAFSVQTHVLRFTPGSEFRGRLGVDRAIGSGHFSVGGTYSTFTSDKADSTSFATGARMLGQATYTRPVGDGGDLTISGWDLYRAAGEQFAAKSKAENVLNGSVALGLTAGSVYVQPSIEARAWTREGEKAGELFNAGVRFRFSAGALSYNPSVGYSIGKYYPEGSTTSLDITGLKAALLIRFR